MDDMKKIFQLPAGFLLAMILSIPACSTGPQVNPAVVSAATSRGVSTATTSKMSAGAKLSYGDIRNLVSAKVPDRIIIDYINSTRQVVDLTADEIAGLKSDGADGQLISYFGETAGFYGKRPAPRSGPAMQPAGAYTNSRAYQDEQPFAYNEPIIDGFYNSGYEESLYSPFSFN